MGEIYQGRYVSGVVAGLKLQELIDAGAVSEAGAKVGYVAAIPCAEVISGYTAFLLGVRSVVPTATMSVRYTNTWTSYDLEKKAAEALLAEGCVILSQHSDTIGPAVACEAKAEERPVFIVGYNQSMMDVAPTTALVSCRINWGPYVVAAFEAVLAHDPIEKHVKAHVHGNDASAGFQRDWVQMLELNDYIAAEGTREAMEEAIADLRAGRVQVFKGPYTGVNFQDPGDTVDLSGGFTENRNSSAPSFCYILEGIVNIRGN
jgi:basic membrane protein A